jgi:ferritin-like metal-binding protein YciE
MPELQEFLVDELKDLLSAESQLVKALPKLAKAAHNPKLKAAFEKHAQETQGHVDRLKQIFETLGESARAKPCKAMQGLLEEGMEMLEEGKSKEESISDLGLVASAQKVEHYEMASYGTARAIAEQLGQKKIVKLLQQTLKEEEKTDSLLTKLSQPVLIHAMHLADGAGTE